MEKLELTKKYQKYSEYKDSGAEWLGKIPKGWDAIKFKANFKVSNERVSDDPKVETLLSVSGYRGIETKNIDSLEGQMPSEDVSGYRIVRRGQLVVNTMWLNYTGLGVSKYEGYVSPAYRSYNISEKMLPDFVNHIMRSGAYVQKYSSLLYGIRPNSLQVKPHDFEKIEVLMPSTEEQEKIARYLDEKTASIDQIIEKKQKQIELLSEKRTAVINHAVTKGLDPKAELVDSGIDWIGKIPKGWEVKKLKSGFGFEKGKEAGKFTQEFVGHEDNVGEFPVYSGQTENEGVLGMINSFKYDYPDGVLFSTTVGAKAMTTKLLRGKFSLSQNCVLMVPNRRADSAYFNYLLEIGFKRMRDDIPSHMQPSLRVSDLNKFTVLFPAIEEQKIIASYLEEKVGYFDVAIKYVEQSIGLLQEFKSSLISHVVTGKVKI